MFMNLIFLKLVICYLFILFYLNFSAFILFNVIFQLFIIQLFMVIFNHQDLYQVCLELSYLNYFTLAIPLIFIIILSPIYYSIIKFIFIFFQFPFVYYHFYYFY